MGCGFSVITAARKAREGANLREIMQTVENTIMRTHILGMITDIDYLLHGRRLSLPWTHVFLGQLGSIIRCKLVGEIYEAGLVRGRGIHLREKKALERLQECILEHLPDSIEGVIVKPAVVHGHSFIIDDDVLVERYIIIGVNEALFQHQMRSRSPVAAFDGIPVVG